MCDCHKLSRRAFAALPLAAPLAAQQAAPNPNTAEQQRHGTMAEVNPFGPTLDYSKNPAPLKARPFPLKQLRLLPGVLHEAAAWNAAYMHRLTADRLTHNFLLNAGLPSSAKPFGGWEDPKVELRGHFTGHYLSAAALLYSSTADAAIKARGDEIVATLARCQSNLKDGYLSAFPIEFFERLDARKKVWAPFYTIHKIQAGLLDMHTLAGNKQALDILLRTAEWTDTWSARMSEEHMQDILNTEYGGMNDLFYKLAALTGEQRWARVGDRFTKKRFFNPLALHRDQLRGLHVNTHIPQVIGAALRYELTSDPRFSDVARFFFHTVTTSRSYATTGTSNGEGWLAPPHMLAAELPRSIATAECCCSYNMLKLARHLFTWAPDPRLFDYYERALFNHRLGTIQPKSGATMYYLSHTPGAWKTFNTEDASFWCCTGTGVEEFAKLTDSIYWHDDSGLWVNLFIPSELDWTERGLRIKQTTAFPNEQSTTLTFTAARPVRLTLRLRIPAWLASAPTVKLNGKPLDASAEPGSYLSITRTWATGDRIELPLPMHLATEPLDGDPTLRAALYGPLVLAAHIDGPPLTPAQIVGSSDPDGLKAADYPAIDAKAIKQESPQMFRAGAHSLSPLNSIFDRRYSIYFRAV